MATRSSKTHARPFTVTRILELQRDDNDMADWVEVDVISTRADASVALWRWLLEQDPKPLPGSYRAVNDRGGRAEEAWSET
jgi:hypothetical protein